MHHGSARNIMAKEILAEFKCHLTPSKSYYNYFNNTDALVYAKDRKYHRRSKSMDTCYHFIPNTITKALVTLKYIHASSMIVNPFTTPIARDAFCKHVRTLGLLRV